MIKDTEQLNKHTHTSKRGSIIVDAAISIPIFVLAMCFLLTMIIHVRKEETAVSKMLKTSQATSMALAAAGSTSAQELTLFDEGHFFLYRPFVGDSNLACGEMVYIFPKYGMRYHIDGCSTLKEGEIATVLTSAVKIAPLAGSVINETTGASPYKSFLSNSTKNPKEIQSANVSKNNLENDIDNDKEYTCFVQYSTK